MPVRKCMKFVDLYYQKTQKSYTEEYNIKHKNGVKADHGKTTPPSQTVEKTILYQSIVCLLEDNTPATVNSLFFNE